jgi:hypothetical protein
MSKQQLKLLVGDNAFHGISHLSQQRARERSLTNDPSNTDYATQLVKLSLQNGASGFMFSVSEKTLAIVKALNQGGEKPELYAIVPYAFEYVRLATRIGGISGLAKKIARDIIFSRNIITVAPSALGLIRADPKAFLRIYLIYEISRIKSAAGKGANLKSVLLHEVITDMALGLDLDWFFKYYIKFFSKSKTRPGFETRNFPYLIQKFKEWQIDTKNLIITCSFNKIGFQMNPSQEECEKTLKEIPQAEIIAMSVLAAGYLKPFEAAQYIGKLSNISHVVVGVSKESQARETFNLLATGIDGKDPH